MSSSIVSSGIRPLRESLLLKAVEELNEVPSRTSTDIDVLRNWLQKQPHLSSCLTDQFLLGFLRGSKFSLEKAKQKIDRYYSLQADIPEVFNKFRLADDPQVLEILRMGIILRIPLDDNDVGPAVTIIRAGSYDSNKFKFQDIIRVGSMFAEIMMLDDDNANVSGYIEILDMNGVTGSSFFALPPHLLSKFAVFADEALPIRQKGMHFINVPEYFEIGFNTLRSLFSDRMKKRVSVSSDPEAIYELVCRKYLPQEYGGTNGTIQDIIAQMEIKLFSYRDHFEQSRHFGTNEKLRKDHSGTIDRPSNFGLEGSFRKLDID